MRELQRERWWYGRWRCRAEELHGLPPRQLLRSRLPEGPPQAAQEGMQETRCRAQGRAAVRPGAREAGGGLLPDLHSADSIANRTALTVHLLLYEESLQRLFTCCVSARDGRHLPFCRTPVPNDDATSLAMVQKRIDVGDAVAMVWDQSMRTMNLGGRTTMAMVLGRIK